MARVFITGSVDGLGRAAAQALLGDGHEIVVHARSTERLAAVGDLLDRGAAAVVGDLSDLEETRGVAAQVNGRRIEPGKVFDLELPLDQAADGYRAMDQREAIKVLLRP